MLVATPPAVDAASPDPYAIFARARAYWEHQRYPERVEYTVAVRVVEGTRTLVERYASGYDAEDGRVVFDAVSDAERAHPVTPHGIGFSLMGSYVGGPEAPIDYLGVPILAPNYSFGIGTTPLTPPPQPKTDAQIVREVREQFHDPDPRAHPAASPPAETGLHEIAEVVSKSRAYDISIAGTDVVDGAPAYHLRMQPLHDPARYRLRELWVDAATYAPRKLVEALNFVNGPGTTVPWSVTFADVGGALYVGTETALGPMRYQHQRYAGASVSIEDVRSVDRFPPELSSFVPDDGPLLMVEP